MVISYNFDHLPDSVLTLAGYDFNQFIRNTLGEPEADLLSKISIQTVSSFLLTENPLDIFNHDIDDDELEELKKKLCFKLKNKKMLIKPGVISGFQSLREALKRKVDQQLTQPKKKQRRSQQLSNINSLSLPVITTSMNQSTRTNKFSLEEHGTHVQKLINKWCSENGDNLGLGNFNLTENVDFFLKVEFDENFNVKGNIKCKCNKLISLANNDDRLQISNFYKHLQSNGCEHMKNLRRNARNLKSIEQQQQSSTQISFVSSSPSNSSSVQVASTSTITSETTTRDESPVLSNENVRGVKRRLTSLSQQNKSAKRNRL